jgi:hypothetical protein
MPTYRFKDHNTGEIWEDLMLISEMEKFIKKKHIELLPPTQMNIVSSVGTLDGKTDNGWKETLSKISEAHPDSHLANQYGKKSIKDVQISNMRKKHKNRILKGGGR